MGIAARKSKNKWMPDYTPNEEQLKAYHYCLKNDIKISPGGYHKEGEWTIDIYSKGRWVKSPKTFKRDEIWEVFYNYCIYYYEKRKKR